MRSLHTFARQPMLAIRITRLGLIWPHLILIQPHAGGLARFYASPISPSAESEALRTLSAAPLLAAELTSLCLPPSSAQVFMALDAGVDNICKVLTGPRH